MRNASIYEFVLAIVVLWLVMEYVPEGVYFGVAVLFVTFLSTPESVNRIAGLLNFIQTGKAQ